MTVMIIDSIVYCNYLFNTGENTAVLSVIMLITYGIDTCLLFIKGNKKKLIIRLDE